MLSFALFLIIPVSRLTGIPFATLRELPPKCFPHGPLRDLERSVSSCVQCNTQSPYGRTSPSRTFRSVRIGQGQSPVLKINFFGTGPKTARPPDLKKTHCSCILEGHLPAESIMSALHLKVQNPIYMFTSIE